MLYTFQDRKGVRQSVPLNDDESRVQSSTEIANATPRRKVRSLALIPVKASAKKSKGSLRESTEKMAMESLVEYVVE